MKRWLSGAFLAVAVAVSACGGTIEADESELSSAPESVASEPGEVDQMLPQCDTEGRCPVGYYCVGGPGGICRRGIIEVMAPLCNSQGQCPAGYYCVGGPGGACRKAPIEVLSPLCGPQGQCPEGYYCAGGVCRKGIIHKQ
jgi:hypothetical protein